DAQTALDRFIIGDRPDAKRFDETIGAAVRRICALGRPRIYGEMVDILAGRGLLDAAYELEILWNELAARESFHLLCGYTSAHFRDPRDASALYRICRAHSSVQAGASDILGSWLLA